MRHVPSLLPLSGSIRVPMTTASPVPPSTPIPTSGYRSVFAPGLFAGKRLWVTGGGSGIGRAVAHELASLGADVLISGRSADKLERVAAEIAEDGGRCAWRAFDIRDEDAVKANVADVVAREGVVHGLVNNAGGQFPAPHTLAGIAARGIEASLRPACSRGSASG